MFARLRPALLPLVFLPFCCASDDVLFTSSVTYCEPPESLLIQQFDVKYTAHNQSISFDISAQSVESNINVSANILLNIYGLTPINITVDLCNILAGALCPLPMYDFNGSDSISLPEGLGVTNRFPAIAFRIPDLEAFAQLTLTEVGTGDVKACLQATLSNGWSTRQPAVEWATAGLALLALLSAAWQSAVHDAVIPYRLLDLLHLYQTIAATAFLSLNYPSVYRAFAINFAWAMGLISSPSLRIQHSIDNMRALTGGNMANASSGPAVGLVDRRLSPWNDIALSSTSSFTQSLLSQPASSISTPSNLSFSRIALNSIQQLDGLQTVTDQSSNVLQAGVPIYVNSIHIATANAFMTTFLIGLIAMTIALTIAGLAGGAIYAAGRFIGANRNCGLIGCPPIMILAFYQWSLKDSWLSVLLAVISLLAISALISYPIYLTLRLARRETPDALETHTDHLASCGPLYAQYRTPRYYFFLPLLIASFLKALSGLAQVVLFMIVELGLVVAYIWLKPYRTRGGDVISTYLAIVRLVCNGLMIAFAESLGVAPIPRVAVGAVIILIFSIAVIVMAINIVLHAGVNRLWRRNSSARSPSQGSADESRLEKGDISPVESNTGLIGHVRSSSHRSLPSPAHDMSTHRHSDSPSSHLDADTPAQHT
ncbi:hypothetical protein B0H10DRAFT_2121062 [Mycena sp. CBHHK59/15]|nr:hypothetical protein B0H10DRAFT_2121062 [Mycena sp. CBHHK59/15]